MDEDSKSPRAFRTISEVSEEIGVPQHVLRFWESKFPAIKPLKRGGNRRYYRPDDLQLLRAINRLLYSDGYTIRGVQKLLSEQGVKAVVGDEPAVPRTAGAPAMLFETDVAVDAGMVGTEEQGGFRPADHLAELRAIRALLADGLARDRAA